MSLLKRLTSTNLILTYSGWLFLNFSKIENEKSSAIPKRLKKQSSEVEGARETAAQYNSGSKVLHRRKYVFTCPSRAHAHQTES